jgi:hypothetical protein
MVYQHQENRVGPRHELESSDVADLGVVDQYTLHVMFPEPNYRQNLAGA